MRAQAQVPNVAPPFATCDKCRIVHGPVDCTIDDKLVATMDKINFVGGKQKSYCHTLISSGSTCGRSLNLVCSLRNPRNKHRCIIRKVSQHSGRKKSISCIIRKVSQHSGKKIGVVT